MYKGTWKDTGAQSRARYHGQGGISRGYHRTTVQPAIPFLGIDTKELETGTQNKTPYVKVHSNTTHNSQSVETT